MANQIYNSFKGALASGQVNMSTATFKLLLTTSSYSFSQSHRLTGDITNEISSTNYTVGGQVISNTVVYTDPTNNVAGLSGDSVGWTNINATPYYGIVYIAGGTPATSLLVEKIDFNGTAVSNADFTVNWGTQGILYF